MKCRLINLALAGALAGCGTTPPPATLRVDVPVSVPCVNAADMPKRPAYAVERLPAQPSDGEKVLALAADWPVGRKYEGQLEAALVGCIPLVDAK